MKPAVNLSRTKKSQVMASSIADPKLEKKEEEVEAEVEENPTGDDEDTGAQVAPIVRLQEVAVSTGEEDEHVLLDLLVSLFLFVCFFFHSSRLH